MNGEYIYERDRKENHTEAYPPENIFFTVHSNIIELNLSTDKNGWCYSCASIKKNLFRKFSINADGSMRNEGKVSCVYVTDIVKQAEKSTKYAVLTPMMAHNFHQNGEF